MCRIWSCYKLQHQRFHPNAKYSCRLLIFSHSEWKFELESVNLELKWEKNYWISQTVDIVEFSINLLFVIVWVCVRVQNEIRLVIYEENGLNSTLEMWFSFMFFVLFHCSWNKPIKLKIKKNRKIKRICTHSVFSRLFTKSKMWFVCTLFPWFQLNMLFFAHFCFTIELCVSFEIKTTVECLIL